MCFHVVAVDAKFRILGPSSTASSSRERALFSDGRHQLSFSTKANEAVADSVVVVCPNFLFPLLNIKIHQIWVPAVILGNLLGVLIFLYSLEASTHAISGWFRKVFCGGGSGKKGKGKKKVRRSLSGGGGGSKTSAAEATAAAAAAVAGAAAAASAAPTNATTPSTPAPLPLPPRRNNSSGFLRGDSAQSTPAATPVRSRNLESNFGAAATAAGGGGGGASSSSSLRARPLPAHESSFLSEEEDEESITSGFSDAGSFDKFDGDDDEEVGLSTRAWVRACACRSKRNGGEGKNNATPADSWCECRVRWVPPGSSYLSSMSLFDSKTLEDGVGGGTGGAPSSPSSATAAAPNSKHDKGGKRAKRANNCPRPIEIAWRDVTCTLTHIAASTDPDDAAAAAIDRPPTNATGKVVLHHCWGEVLPGEMCAIVGPSGAGKSTLLDVLAARKTVGVVSGTVAVGARAVPASSHSRGGRGGGVDRGGASHATLADAALFFREVAAYVPQEDAYVPTLTAAETLTFHARLRARKKGGIGGGWRNDDENDTDDDNENDTRAAATCCFSGSSPANDSQVIAALVREGLAEVGLSRAGGTAVGGTLPLGLVIRGLSTGERRRLSVACALVGSPSLLLLDEPTTGLDAAAALMITRRLASLARRGHTILATVHQPREGVWRAFGKAVLLSEGRQIYSGVASEAASWVGEGLGLGAYKPSRDGAEADWLLDCVNVNFSSLEDNGGAGAEGEEMTTGSTKATTATTATTATRAAAKEALDGSKASPSPSVIPVAGHLRTRADVAAAAAAFVAAHPGPDLGSSSSSPSASSSSSPSSPSSSSSSSKQNRRRRSAGQLFSWPYASSFATQLRVLLVRALRAQLRNPGDAASRTLVSSWVGTFGGLVFLGLGLNAEAASERYVAAVFVMLAYAMMPFGYISLYSADRAFYVADVAAGLYHPLAYYLASALAAAPLLIVNTWCGAFAAYGLANLGPSMPQILAFGGFMAVQGLLSAQLLVAATYVTPTQDMAYLLSIAYLSASLMLDGTYVRFTEMTALQRGISNLSYLKFMLFGLLGVEFDPVKKYPPRSNGKPPCISRGALGATAKELSKLVDTAEARQRARLGGLKCEDVVDGHAALKVFMSTMLTSPENAAAILVGFLVVFHVIAYVGARYMYKAQR